MKLDSDQQLALNALLAMQRHSGEQGLLGHALLDLEQWSLAEGVARDAVARQNPHGRLASLSGDDDLTASSSLGEIVAWASIRDESLRPAFGRHLGWLMTAAPRTADGTLLHRDESREVSAEGLYAILPLLVLANEDEAALAQFQGHRERLFVEATRLWGSQCSSGWVVAGIARAIHLGLHSTELADHARVVLDALLAVQPPHDSGTTDLQDTTAGTMTAYALLQGVGDGWLSAEYADAGHTLVAHARTRVDEHGLVQGDLGASERPRTSATAQAFFLLASAADTRRSN